MKVKYFAYGSNLHPQRFAERIPDAKVHSIAYLPGYQLCFHKKGGDGSGKANAFATADARHAVHGIIYEIASRHQQVLDEAEIGYEARFLEVHTSRGSHRVFTYVAQQHMIVESLQPYDWYREYIMKGAIFHGFERDYLSQITNQSFKIDPDDTRRLMHRSILDT